jgi:CHAT domain-containing protein/tetratricopeptide (TPR) repeat protein
MAEVKAQYSENQFSRMLPMVEQALDLNLRVWGQDSEEYGHTLGWLGLVCIMQTEAPRASAALDEAIAIARQIYPDGHPWLAGLINQKGQLAFSSGDCRLALEYYTKALEMRALCRGGDHPSVAFSHLSLARTYTMDVAFYDAARCEFHIEEARRILDSSLGKNHQYSDYLLASMINHLFRSGKMLEAITVADHLVAKGSIAADYSVIRLRGWAEACMGRLVKSRASTESALKMALEEGRVDAVLGLRIDLVQVCRFLGDFASAERELEMLKVSIDGANRENYALHAAFQAMALAEVQQDFERVWRIFDEDVLPQLKTLSADHDICQYLPYPISFLMSYQRHEETRDLVQSLSWTEGCEHAVREARGRLALMQGRYADAIEELNARSDVQAHWTSFGRIEKNLYLAQAYAGLQNWEKAEEHSAKAVEDFDSSITRAETWDWGNAWSPYFGDILPHYHNVVFKLQIGDETGATEVLVQRGARNLHRLMVQGAALAGEDELRSRFFGLEDRAVLIGRAGAGLGNGSPGLRLGMEEGGFEDESWIRHSQARLWASRDSLLQSGSIPVIEDIGLTQMAEKIPEGTALVGWLSVEIFPGNWTNWAYVWRHGEMARFLRLDTGPSEALAQRQTVAQMRIELQNAAQWPGSLAVSQELMTLATGAHEHWFAPLEPWLGDASSLVVVSTGPLMGLPIEALAGPDGTFAGDRRAISYIPASRVYAHLKDKEAQDTRTALASCLLVGAPVLGERASGAEAMEVASSSTGGDDSPGGAPLDMSVLREAAAGDFEALKELPELPFAESEIRDLATRLPGAVVLAGERASEQNVYQEVSEGRLEQYDVIHFAAHALMNPNLPERSAIVLSQVGNPDPADSYLKGERIIDGLLSSRDIRTDMRLNADLVTLSACQTGLGRVATGEGHIGLTSAFLIAGARNVLSSLWKVADRPTNLLMTRFYDNLLGSPEKSKVQALQEAKRWLREFEAEDGSRPYAHPVYWAGFVLTGAGD